MSEWRGIASAPKMKTLLLWAATDIGPAGEVRNWKMETGFFHTGYDAWNWDGRILKEYEVHPTHWMPLPEPPTPEAT